MTIAEMIAAGEITVDADGNIDIVDPIVFDIDAFIAALED